MLMHPAEYLDNPTLSEHAKAAYHKSKPHAKKAYEKSKTYAHKAYEKSKPHVKRAAKATARGALKGGAYGVSALSRGLAHAASRLTHASQSARLKNPAAWAGVMRDYDMILRGGMQMTARVWGGRFEVQILRDSFVQARGTGPSLDQAMLDALMSLGAYYDSMARRR